MSHCRACGRRSQIPEYRARIVAVSLPYAQYVRARLLHLHSKFDACLAHVASLVVAALCTVVYSSSIAAFEFELRGFVVVVVFEIRCTYSAAASWSAAAACSAAAAQRTELMRSWSW
jgi:hypothetical protein